MYIQTKDTERNNSVHHRMGHSNQEVNVRLGTGMFDMYDSICYTHRYTYSEHIHRCIIIYAYIHCYICVHLCI